MPLPDRVERGDVVVLDHVDLDAATAQVLVDAGVAAVVNAAPSSSGRYPNAGPSLLLAAGIGLLDDVGSGALVGLREGAHGVLDGDALVVDDQEVARGMRQDLETVATALDWARTSAGAQLADLAGTAAAVLPGEQELLLGGQGLPDLGLASHRPAVLVGPAYGGAEELRALRRRVRRSRALVVAVDAGADVARRCGLDVDVLVADPGRVGAEALRGARHVVLVGEPRAHARAQDLAVAVRPVVTALAPEDVALLLLQRAEVASVVVVGLPRDLPELLDRGRAASGSPFVRMALGSRLLGGAGLAALPAPRRWPMRLLALLLAALLAGVVGLEHHDLLARWDALAP